MIYFAPVNMSQGPVDLHPDAIGTAYMTKRDFIIAGSTGLGNAHYGYNSGQMLYAFSTWPINRTVRLR